MTELQWGICGSIAPNTRPEDAPYTYLENTQVQRLLLELNSRPHSRSGLQSLYPELAEQIAEMLRLQMLRDDGDRLAVNFTLLDERDKQLVWQVSDRHARALAAMLLANRQRIHAALLPLGTPWVDVRQLAFLAAGCYLLDWGALELLNGWGVIKRDKPQAGGNVYTLWAEVQLAGSLRAVYWGGHDLAVGPFLLHTFGDHAPETRRLALPDLLWRVYQGDIPGREQFRVLQLWKNAELGLDLARIMDSVGRQGADRKKIGSALPDCDQDKLDSMLKWLQALGCIDRLAPDFYVLRIPFFTLDDWEAVGEVARAVVPALRHWVEADLRQYERDIAELNPLRNGVPFSEVFVQCWHYVFGLTNKYLAEQGLICDTYGDRSRWHGYLPGLIKGPLLKKLNAAAAAEFIAAVDKQDCRPGQ